MPNFSTFWESVTEGQAGLISAGVALVAIIATVILSRRGKQDGQPISNALTQSNNQTVVVGTTSEEVRKVITAETDRLMEQLEDMKAVIEQVLPPQPPSPVSEYRLPIPIVDYSEEEIEKINEILEAGDKPKALLELDRLISVKPDSVIALHAKALVHLMDGEFTAAKSIYLRLMEINANDPLLLNNLGYCCMILGDSSAGQVYLQKGLELQPRNPYLHYNLAALEYPDNPVKALERLQFLVDEIVEFPPAFTLAADIFFELQDFQRARTNYINAGNLGDTSPSVDLGIARSNVKLHSYDGAIQHLKMAERKSGPSTDTALMKAWCYSIQGLWPLAESEVQIARSIDFTDPRILTLEGHIALSLGKLDEAEEIFLAGIRAYPLRAVIFRQALSIVYVKKKDFENAFAQIQSILEVKFELTSAKACIVLAIELGRLDEAIQVLGEVEKRDANAFDVPLFRSLYAAVHGQPDKARQELKKAIQLNDQVPALVRGTERLSPLRVLLP